MAAAMVSPLRLRHRRAALLSLQLVAVAAGMSPHPGNPHDGGLRQNPTRPGAASKAGNCTARVDGVTIDLSRLHRSGRGGGTTPGYYVMQSIYQDVQFYFNVCGPIVYPDGGVWCHEGTTGCCEVQDGTAMGIQGYATDKVELHDGEHGVPPGLVTRMNGGSCAGDRSRQGLTEIYFVCDPEATAPRLTKITDDFWLCILRVKMATREACKPAMDRKRLSPQKLLS